MPSSSYLSTSGAPDQGPRMQGWSGNRSANYMRALLLCSRCTSGCGYRSFATQTSSAELHPHSPLHQPEPFHTVRTVSSGDHGQFSQTEAKWPPHDTLGAAVVGAAVEGGSEGGGVVGGGDTEHSVQPMQPFQVHLSSQPCVLSSQNGLHTGAGREHSVQPLQPFQVHLSVQPCVLSSQNGLHSGSGTMHSVQPVQPVQVHLSSHACVLSSQNGLHTGAGAEHSVQL